MIAPLKARAWLLTLVLLAVPACGDDDGGSTNQNDAGVDADPHFDGRGRGAFRCSLGGGAVAFGQGLNHVHRRRDRSQGVVRLGRRSPEVRHHRVADELVDGSTAAEDDVRDQLEGLVEEAPHGVGEDAFR